MTAPTTPVRSGRKRLLDVLRIGFLVLVGLSLWAFVDAILMWTGSVRDGNGRKLGP